MADEKRKLELVPDDPTAEPIKKPGPFTLDKFKSKTAPTIAGVETLQGVLSHHSLAQAKDFVRLHPNEDNYWTAELCFVNVPIKGQKGNTLHLIVEDIAKANLPSARIQRFRLALATKPNDVFFLCHVPTRNLDNSWNKSNRSACEQAKTFWTALTSRKEEGYEDYDTKVSRDEDAFPEPNWPTQSLDALIQVTFAGCMIETNDHPGLLRLIGAKQQMS